MKKPETSASKPVRGKYANLLKEGSNVAVLDPDIAPHFHDSESVNNALRAFLAIGKEVQSASVLAFPAGSRSRRAPGKRGVSFDPLNGAAVKRRASAK